MTGFLDSSPHHFRAQCMDLRAVDEATVGIDGVERDPQGDELTLHVVRGLTALQPTQATPHTHAGSLAGLSLLRRDGAGLLPQRRRRTLTPPFTVSDVTFGPWKKEGDQIIYSIALEVELVPEKP